MCKCVICERRPANGDGVHCHNCMVKLQKAKQNGKKLHRYLTYRGHVVGIYRYPDGRLIGEVLSRDPEKLPKRRTLDLNTYLDGFSRGQVKKLKAQVLALASPSLS